MSGVALHGAVDGGTANRVQLSQIGDGVVAGGVLPPELSLLPGGQFGLFAFEGSTRERGDGWF